VRWQLAWKPPLAIRCCTSLFRIIAKVLQFAVFRSRVSPTSELNWIIRVACRKKNLAKPQNEIVCQRTRAQIWAERTENPTGNPSHVLIILQDQHRWRNSILFNNISCWHSEHIRLVVANFCLGPCPACNRIGNLDPVLDLEKWSPQRTPCEQGATWATQLLHLRLDLFDLARKLGAKFWLVKPKTAICRIWKLGRAKFTPWPPGVRNPPMLAV